ELFSSLHADGTTIGTIMADNLSPKVLTPGYSLHVQDDQLMHALSSLMLVQLQNRRSPSAAEIVKSLAKETPFVGVAVSTSALMEDTEPFFWAALRKVAPRVAARGTGDVDDVIRVAKRALEECLTEESCWTIADRPDPQALFYAIFSIPFRPGDRRWMPIST